MLARVNGTVAGLAYHTSALEESAIVPSRCRANRAREVRSEGLNDVGRAVSGAQWAVCGKWRMGTCLCCDDSHLESDPIAPARNLPDPLLVATALGVISCVFANITRAGVIGAGLVSGWHSFTPTCETSPPFNRW